MNKITSCLWFNNQAEEAVSFYTSLFENSKIGNTARYGESGAQVSGQKKDSILTIDFLLENQAIVALNGGPEFKFTPALSFFVWRKTEKEVEDLWNKLTYQGEIRMDLSKYPWSAKYGWTKDKFGVDWQIMISPNQQKIAPSILFVDKLFGKGQEALQFYKTVFADTKIESMEIDKSTNSVLHCLFSIYGQEFVLMEGQGIHNFTFSPAFSFIINCNNQDEIDKYWTALSTGDFTEQCGWVKDKYGISWQVVPSILGELMRDPKKSENVMKAMLKMKKLKINELINAYEKNQ